MYFAVAGTGLKAANHREIDSFGESYRNPVNNGF